jgi:hypothetical protein
LFKPSIRLEEDIPVPKPRISPGEDIPMLVPTPGIPPGKDDPVLTSEVKPGASALPIEPNLEPEGEIAVVVGPLDPKVDWRKPISEYL